MAEPTLKDVLNAILRLEKGQANLDAKVTALDAKVEAHRGETAKGFATLDKELADHSDPHHREIERTIEKLKKDLATLKGRPAARPARRPRPR